MWRLITKLLGSKIKDLSPRDKPLDSVNLTYTCNSETMANIFKKFVLFEKNLASKIPTPSITAYPVVDLKSHLCYVRLILKR